MSNIRKNDKAIDRGLDWLTKQRDTIIEQAMLKILPMATEYAIALHDHEHFGHRIAGDTHGWALVKGGSIVKMEVNDGRHGEGEAHKQLRDVARSIVNDGYTGIVLASMTAHRNNGKPIIFEIEYEIDILTMTAEELRKNFNRYFKKKS